ncbi:BMP family ABC transporter substrate-binding protein [Rhodobacteraceae bacterium WD3A24]|nr:BMP family ABC transporter substrate-binding protein [Rhodobacteraceae bacterium WD3A24]
MKHARLLTGALMALALAAPAAAQDDPVKVGFIYVGPVGDFGWTHEHDLARQAVEEEYGDAVETSFVESVPEGPDAERVMTQMALSGTDLIFATSFGYGPAVNNVAERFPDVAFEHATGYQQDHPNVSLYNARFYQGRAVIGHIAGHMTETSTIGYIASFPIPEVIRGINAAFIHAREVNPDVEFRIVWAYSWFDPAQEASAAEALIEQGADILMQHTDSTAPMSIAEDRGLYAFGQASNMIDFGPNAQLTAIIDNWAPYYIERVGEVMDGTWEAGNVWTGIGDGTVAFADFSDAIPEEVRESAAALRDRIAAGDYHPFTGPINRRDGSEWLAEGEVATDEALLAMDFYVEGITSELPE